MVGAANRPNDPRMLTGRVYLPKLIRVVWIALKNSRGPAGLVLALQDLAGSSICRAPTVLWRRI